MTATTQPPAARWGLPDSDLCTAALQLTFEVSPVFLAHHCVRSYLFARELAAAQAITYDEELVFLACILHDLGITDHGDREHRFEVDGADAAARFLREHGVPEELITPVWQAITLHTSVGIVEHFGIEHAVSHFGITLDINGFGGELLPAGFAERVHSAWPRHDLGYAIAGEIAARAQDNPAKAPPLSFPAHVQALVSGARGVDFFDVVASSPWNDRPAGAGR